MNLTKTQTKKSFAIPIRLSLEEKYVLEEFSRQANLPLSTFIKSKLQPLMAPRLKKLTKTQILLQKIKTANIPASDINLASEHGLELRRNMKLTRG